ncbi:mannan endo-1,4-beta-mannosidase [Asanoa hainanensis]|uniref:Endoglucanase n=1 Tax=Asanoa hainanensis TaxID=560556 RepID=A0A239LH71_9ACTN|nr:cellulase family glycosylhydrolase [Asanoa hainanensis]SNT29262.1 mannan endo-1,4-beta-mannosidase [Asanoa hainanensis]
MRPRLLAVVTALSAAALAAMFVLTVGSPARAATGFTVTNGRLYDANGTEFVMRGVSHAHTWYQSQTRAFADIKATGANTVRVVLSGGRWPANSASDVSNVVSLCRQNRLICVLENHDTTGYGEQSGSVPLSTAVDYWISLRDVLAGQERYVIINIGNEPVGNNAVSPTWTQATTTAIQRMRTAGFDHTLMVDAPNWGQDWRFEMRDNAASVFAADPDRNTVFSIHMYGVFDTAAEITDYLGRFRTAGLPIVVGEFGFNHSDGNPDEDTIMSYTQANRIGYIGWSWSGNGGGVEYLDMVTGFDPTRPTSWGQRIIDGANGIRSTSREATVFGGGGPTGTPTSTPTSTPTTQPTTPPPARGCSAAYRVIGSWPGGFQGEVTVTAGSAAISAWTVGWTWANGQRVTQSWNTTLTTSGSAVSARNVSYNGNLGAGASATFGFLASWTGSNTAPTATCTAS